MHDPPTNAPEHRETVAAYLKPVREILEPDKMEFFAGLTIALHRLHFSTPCSRTGVRLLR